MNELAKHSKQVETEFLAGVELNLERAKGRLLKGTQWERTSHDENERVRALMAQRQKTDRKLLNELPQNRRVVLHGYERRFLFGRRRTVIAIATVLSPVEACLDDQPEQQPVDVNGLMEHVRKVIVDKSTHHIIGVCSPTGFTDDVKGSGLELPNATLVLIEPGEEGGWKTTGLGKRANEDLQAIFDPEAVGHKAQRVRREIRRRSAELLTGSLSARDLARDLGVPEDLAEMAFEMAAEEDPELKVTRKSGETLLFRGAAQTTTETGMNVVDRIRQLFSKEGDEARKINVLSESKAALAKRRDRLYEDITKLEKREAQLLEEGRQATSDVVKRRLAAQVNQLRKDIRRQNTTAAMLNQQLNIISTDIHNLTLIQQGEMAKLPETEELTENAVKAEEMLETLKVDADLVAALETGVSETVTSDEELEILKEFEAAPPEPSAAEPEPVGEEQPVEEPEPEKEKDPGQPEAD